MRLVPRVQRAPGHLTPARARSQARRWPPVVVGALVGAAWFGLVGCGSGSSGVAPGGAAASSGCPYGDTAAVAQVVVLELSPSERSAELVGDRLDRIRAHAGRAADCEARFQLTVLEGGRAETVYEIGFDSALGTERARDLKVGSMVAEAMAGVEAALAPYLARPVPAGSDPGAAFRVLDELLSRLGPDQRIDALILSDGITSTGTVELNRPLEAAEVAALAGQVAPPVDLQGRVAIDWPGVGRTVDAVGPPGPWLDRLVAVWITACQDRSASSCLVTST